MMRYTITFCLASLLGQPVLAEVPRVVTDIVPVHALVASVMGDLGAPQVLLPKGADPHDFQLRPSQAGDLAKAGLIVRIGPAMTPWLDRALDGIGTKARIITLMEASTIRPYDDHEAHDDHDDHATEGHDNAAEGHDHAAEGHDDHKTDGHDHAAEGHDHAAEGHDDHDHGDTDPHVWLDPENARAWLPLIAAELAALDPANAATYAANAAVTAGQITAVEAEVSALLAPVKSSPFMVFHNAYGYFADHFGLTIAGTIRQGDAATPGARHLADLRDQAQTGAALCLFPEAGHDPAQALQMVEGTSLRLGAALDPEGSQIDPAPTAYASLMRSLATAIADCLQAR